MLRFGAGEKMKVLWFTNTPCGASEIISPRLIGGGWLNSLEREVAKNLQIELHICFFWKDCIEKFQHNGINYHPIQKIWHRTKFRRIIGRILAFDDGVSKDTASLLDIIDAIAPDIIHIHGTEHCFGLIQAQTHIPTVISMQGILSSYVGKFFSGMPFVDSLMHEEFLSLVKMESQIFSYWRMQKAAKREREILRRAKHIIGRTSWDRRITSILAPNAQYRTGNEIMRPEFYSHEWKRVPPSSPFIIVTTMSGALFKGFEVVIRTAQILKEYSFLKFEWIVIGQAISDTLVKKFCKWLNADLSLLNIRLVGQKDAQSMIEIMRDADVYCQVSHIENSPNSICEAMLLGMPIIASFAGGTDSICRNGQNGILIQDGDAYSYAGAIMEIMENFQLAVDLGHQSKEDARHRHDPEAIASQLISDYASISR